jgi:hypothetical protein
MNARSVRCAVIQEKSWQDDNLTGKDPLGGSAFAKETSVREAINKVARPKGNSCRIESFIFKKRSHIISHVKRQAACLQIQVD